MYNVVVANKRVKGLVRLFESGPLTSKYRALHVSVLCAHDEARRDES